MKTFYLNVILLLLISSCKTEIDVKQNIVSEEIPWHLKDFNKDSIAGISLEKAYSEILNLDLGEEVIVAVIDSHIDLYHDDLRNQIYTNPNEIPGNNIDDDNNGYVDDIHGWNFLGYKNERNSLRYALRVHTRIVKRYDSIFNGKEKNEINTEQIENFNKYTLSKIELNKSVEESKIYLKQFPKYKEIFKQAYSFFGDKINLFDDYTQEQLDNLIPRNKEEIELILDLKSFLNAGVTYDYLLQEEKNDLVNIYIGNNINYDEREKIGDNQYKYDEKYYGNNLTNVHYNIDHGTQIAGVLGATRDNGIGIRGMSNKIKIMPLPILPEKGAENEKDFLNAVKYAVDNGAKIINFSSGISITDNENIMFEALKYAEKYDVLVVNAAGNSGLDNDINNNNHYPRDISFNGETVNNFIKVGASSKYVNEKLFCSWSNYGSNTVDIFAPGEDVTTLSKNSPFIYENNAGSSISAAITSGVAALVLSKYPDLKAKELKEILLESGQEFNVLAVTNELDTIHFKKLSKTGKILNAFNALKLAAKYPQK